MGVGLKKGILTFEEYDPQWPVVARQLIERIRPLVPEAIAFRHVGSTAIPGMLAKPIIDIDVLVNRFDDILKHVDELEEAGVHYVGEFVKNQRDFYINNEDGSKEICYLHAFEVGNPKYEDNELVIEICTADERYAKAYRLIKEACSLILENRRNLYGPVKHNFMEIIIEDAKKRRAEQPHEGRDDGQ